MQNKLSQNTIRSNLNSATTKANMLGIQKSLFQRLNRFYKPQGESMLNNYKNIYLKTFIFLFLFLPTCCVFIYNAFIASPMFISHTKFSIQTSSNTPNIDITSFILRGANSSISDSYLVVEYIQSFALAQKAVNELQFAEKNNLLQYDVFYRLNQESTNFELLSYWNSKVTPTLDTDTGIIHLDVKAFTPQEAQELSAFIIQASENLINTMNERSRYDALFSAKEEVLLAEERVKKAQSDLRTFRDNHALIDPLATGTSLHALVAQLEVEHAHLSTRLKEARSFMRENAPSVIAIETSLHAVAKQLEEEKKRLAGENSAIISISSVAAEYEKLSIELEFAKQQLLSAMNSLEIARIQQSSQSSYLVPIQNATLPDESRYPKPFLFALYTFLGTALTLGLSSLIIVAIREHAGF